MTYPDGYTLGYNYGESSTYATDFNDGIGRLTSLTDSTGTLESYTYLGLDTVLGRAQPEQTLTTTLDTFGNVEEQDWTNPAGTTTNSNDVYTYDGDGNVLSMTDEVNSSLSQTYAHDGLNQVTSYGQGGTTAQSYGYDGQGNRISVTTGGGSPATWGANEQNEITRAGASAADPGYDGNGNMTTDQNGLGYVYDAWGRLVEVTGGGGTVLESMTYDGLGREVTDSVASTGVTTDRFYSNTGQDIEESAGGVYTTRYVYSQGTSSTILFRDTDTSGTGLTATGSGYQRLWPEQNAAGSVVALVNSSGTVVERYSYSAFGVETVMSGGGIGPYVTGTGSGSAYSWVYGFQGMRLDGVSGWNQTADGWYSAALGTSTAIAQPAPAQPPAPVQPPAPAQPPSVRVPQPAPSINSNPSTIIQFPSINDGEAIRAFLNKPTYSRSPTLLLIPSTISQDAGTFVFTPPMIGESKTVGTYIKVSPTELYLFKKAETPKLPRQGVPLENPFFGPTVQPDPLGTLLSITPTPIAPNPLATALGAGNDYPGLVGGRVSPKRFMNLQPTPAFNGGIPLGNDFFIKPVGWSWNFKLHPAEISGGFQLSGPTNPFYKP